MLEKRPSPQNGALFMSAPHIDRSTSFAGWDPNREMEDTRTRIGTLLAEGRHGCGGVNHDLP